MVARTWVGASGGDWNTSSNWSPAGVPTSVDDITITGTGREINVNSVTSFCANFTISSGANLTLTGAYSEFRIYGNFTNSGTLYDSRGLSTWIYYGSPGTKTINYGTHLLRNSIHFTPNLLQAGSWSLLNNLTFESGLQKSIEFIGGAVRSTFSTNNYSISVYQIGGYQRANVEFNLGSSSIFVERWDIGYDTSDAVVNAVASTITFSGDNPYFGAGGKTYHNIVFNSGSVSGEARIYNFTCNNLSLSAPAFNGWRTYWFGSGCTVLGTLSAGSANQAISQRILFTTTLGATISAYIRNIIDADFTGITWAGGSLVGTRLGNCNGNSNITFATPKTVYWVGSIGGSWHDNNWALTSGGTANTANYPLPQDTAVFDNMGVVGNPIVSVLDPIAVGNILITTAASWTLRFYGVIYMFGTSFSNNGTATMSRYTSTAYWSIQPSNNFTLTLNGKQLDATVFVFPWSSTTTFYPPAEIITNFGLYVNAGVINFPVGTMTVGGLFIGENNNGNFKATTNVSDGAILVCTNGEFTAATSTTSSGSGAGRLEIRLISSSQGNKIINIAEGLFSLPPNVFVNASNGGLTFSTLTFNNIDISSFNGNVSFEASCKVVGNVTFPTTSGFTASGFLNFYSTSGTSTFDSKGRSTTLYLDIETTNNATVQLLSNFNSTQRVDIRSGILDFNGYTISADGLFVALGPSSKVLLFNGGNLTLNGTTPLSKFFTGNGVTTVTGRGNTPVISLTNASAKTIDPSGTVWNCIIRNTGAGNVNVTGSGTYIDWENTYTAASVTYTITAGTTHTFLKDLSLTGTSGTSRVNLVSSSGTATYAVVKPTPWAVGTNSTLTGTTGMTTTENNMGRDHLTITRAVATSSADVTSGFLIYTI